MRMLLSLAVMACVAGSAAAQVMYTVPGPTYRPTISSVYTPGTYVQTQPRVAYSYTPSVYVQTPRAMVNVTPSYSQPGTIVYGSTSYVPSYTPSYTTPSYTMPMYQTVPSSSVVYSQPSSTTPSYTTQSITPVVYSTPSYQSMPSSGVAVSQPIYQTVPSSSMVVSQPTYTTPSYSVPQTVYSQPFSTTPMPTYSVPSYTVPQQQPVIYSTPLTSNVGFSTPSYLASSQPMWNQPLAWSQPMQDTSYRFAQPMQPSYSPFATPVASTPTTEPTWNYVPSTNVDRRLMSPAPARRGFAGRGGIYR